MKKQILRDLFGGRISPWERKCDPASDRSKQHTLVTGKAITLRAVLTAEQQPAFEDYVSEHHILTHLAEEDGFVEGFCLATKLILAALDLDDVSVETAE